MNKEMIVSSNGHETMAAILEDDLAAEIFVERERHRGVVGNVYKGRVSKVLPGMQSSFIDIGLERDGFLYVADSSQDRVVPLIIPKIAPNLIPPRPILPRRQSCAR